jgi:hypothetical protein
MHRPVKKIEEDIRELQKELVASKEHYGKILYWDTKNDHNESNDFVGMYNITKLKAILSELVKGTKLLYIHEYYGKYHVYMNPPRNRILVYKINQNGSEEYSENKGVCEDRILNFIMYCPGSWYIINEEYGN